MYVAMQYVKHEQGKCEMTAYTFCIDSMVRGYHEYQSIWDTPLADGDLPCEREVGNSHDSQAVAVVTWCFIF